MKEESATQRDIRRIVNILVSRYHNRNPFYLARRIGIEYFFLDFDDNLQAFSERKDSTDKGRIYINQNYGASAKKILCAHEMGHLMCHGDYTDTFFDPDIEPEKEYEANYFAAMLLPHIILNKEILELPKKAFNEYITQRVNCAFQFGNVITL